MMKDLYIKNKRILLFDFDGTLVETISGGLYAKDLTDMKIKQDVVNRALDLMEQNGVKYFGIISNQVVAMNTTEFSSKVFDSLTPDWLDGRKIKALMPFCIMPGGKVRFSLYECVEDSVDCCEVSKRFGGGGHAGAAGFVIDASSDQFKDFIENHKLTSIQ